MKKVIVIHGPNLNLLGQRDHSHYGSLTLDEINAKILNYSKDNHVDCDIFQFNSELDIINQIQMSQPLTGLLSILQLIHIQALLFVMRLKRFRHRL